VSAAVSLPEGAVGPEPSTLAIPATDGYPLAATHFPARGAARGWVLIGGATGVPRRYYRQFASHVASRGHDVVTFDYRGIAGSRPSRLRGFAATASAWGDQDLAGALAWTSRRAGGQVGYVAHSIGGQLLGLAPNNDVVSRAYFVGVQSGDFRLWPRGLRRVRVAASWYVLPVVSALFGYLPGRLGTGEDLPAGVAREWARWGRTPGYLLGADPSRRAGFERVRAPIRAVAVSDDDFAPEAAVHAMLAAYTNARVRVETLHPADAGAHALGHFGFFRERFRETLWARAVAFLNGEEDA
jgi:predicted alpha/beta hydrolase